MAWQKNVTNHTPDWLRVIAIGWRAPVWEILRFMLGGIVCGVIAGVCIGYAKDDTWNGQQKWAKEVQKRREEARQLVDQICREHPKSGACKPN